MAAGALPDGDQGSFGRAAPAADEEEGAAAPAAAPPAAAPPAAAPPAAAPAAAAESGP